MIFPGENQIPPGRNRLLPSLDSKSGILYPASLILHISLNICEKGWHHYNYELVVVNSPLDNS